MNARRSRFGLTLPRLPRPADYGVAELITDACRAEQIGFDAILVPDHLGMTAPLPELMAIGQATRTVRVGTCLLNIGFYRPALLARDLAAIDSASGGRLDIGLAKGHPEEVRTVGLPVVNSRARVELLREYVIEIRRLLSSHDHVPAPAQLPPPITVAGYGDRLLAMAARHADTLLIGATGDRDHLAERVDYFKAAAGQRLDQIELGFVFHQTAIDDPHLPQMLQLLAPSGRDAEPDRLVSLLCGSITEANDRIHWLRDEFGITYFIFAPTPNVGWTTLEKLIAANR